MTDGASPIVKPSTRSVGEVLTDIGGNLERLVRAEVRLATTGALDRVRSTVLGAALIAGGSMLCALTTGLFMWGAVTRLSEAMKPWQAMVLVAAGTGLLAAVVLLVGVKALREPATPLRSR